MAKGTIKAIIFDLDNTLLDFISMKREASAAAAVEMVRAGLRMDEEEAGKKLFAAYWKYGIDSNTAFTQFLLENTGKVDRRVLGRGISAYGRAKMELLKPYENARITLRLLKKKGITLGIVTDAPREKAIERLHMAGLQGIFDFLVAFDDTKQAKPGGLPFRRAIELAGCKADEMMMVGDSMPRDIVGAQKAGMLAIYAKYGEDKELKWQKAEGVVPDYEISDISELLKIVGS